MTSAAPADIDFWFDPVCPWAWVTSRWVEEVARLRPLRPRWHVMSLTMLNEGRELTDDYRAAMERARGPARVCAAAATDHGEDVLGPLYTELGSRGHVAGRGLGPDVVAEALAAAGLPPDLAAAAEDDAADTALRTSHEDGVGRVGTDVGTPILTVEGRSIFGPVLRRAPRGDAALRLWEGLCHILATDGFFELKRSREGRPAFD